MLNSNKTQCIFIGNKQLLSHAPPNIVIEIDGEVITLSSYVKKLGMYMEWFVLFDKHINEVTQKVTGAVKLLSRVSAAPDKSTRIIVVKLLILSIINYCIRIWGSNYSNNFERGPKTTKLCSQRSHRWRKKYDHVTPIIQELRWIKVKEQHQRVLSIMV